MSSFGFTRGIGPDPLGQGQLSDHHGARVRQNDHFMKCTLLLIVGLFSWACRSTPERSEPGRPASDAAPPSAASGPMTSSSAAVQPSPDAAPEVAPELAAPELPSPTRPPEPATAPSQPPSVQEIFDHYGFPAYANLIHLCGRSERTLMGDSARWDAFTTSDPLDRVLAAYRKKLGERGFTAAAGGGSWVLPTGGTERSLAVLPPSSPGTHQNCATPPKADTASVVVVSRR